MLMPRESSKFIAENSEDVAIQTENIVEAAKILYTRIRESEYSFKIWKEHELHPKEMTRETVDWIFVVDSLNFSFWEPAGKPPFQVEFHGTNYVDYQALCAAINRALEEENIQITSPSFLKDMTLDKLKYVFRSSSETELPLLEERIKHLNQVGKVLVEQYNNSFINVIRECDKSAALLVKKIVELFPSFRDEGIFNNQHVSFYKRAQILVADIWACFEGKGYGEFVDIEFITMFADYRVPQSLQFLGVLKYSEILRKAVRKQKEIPAGSKSELEIRGNSIWVVELLKEEIKKLCKGNNDGISSVSINSVIIDFYLWDYATEHVEKMSKFPEHRTRSIFY